jgi:hypothetical protein
LLGPKTVFITVPAGDTYLITFETKDPAINLEIVKIRFEVLERDPTSVLVAIKATDKQTGVKSLFYSIDNMHEFPYESPVRVKLNEAKFITGVADDNAGNRSVYTYQFERIRD